MEGAATSYSREINRQPWNTTHVWRLQGNPRTGEVKRHTGRIVDLTTIVHAPYFKHSIFGIESESKN